MTIFWGSSSGMSSRFYLSFFCKSFQNMTWRYANNRTSWDLHISDVQQGVGYPGHAECNPTIPHAKWWEIYIYLLQRNRRSYQGVKIVYKCLLTTSWTNQNVFNSSHIHTQALGDRGRFEWYRAIGRLTSPTHRAFCLIANLDKESETQSLKYFLIVSSHFSQAPRICITC